MTTRTISDTPGLPRNADLPRIADFCNQLLRGKLNVTSAFTLAANAATTTIIDARIGPTSDIDWTPTSQHAAAEIAGGAFYLVSRTKGSFVLAHANNPQTDRTFLLKIIG